MFCKGPNLIGSRCGAWLAASMPQIMFKRNGGIGARSAPAFLRRHRRIALDTSVFIYQLEANARYLALTDQIFTWIERPGGKAVTSTITMTELLVQPYRAADQQQADEFYVLLSTYPNLEWIAPNLEIADRAAKLRALHGLRTPDALQPPPPSMPELPGSSPMTRYLSG